MWNISKKVWRIDVGILGAKSEKRVVAVMFLGRFLEPEAEGVSPREVLSGSFKSVLISVSILGTLTAHSKSPIRSQFNSREFFGKTNWIIPDKQIKKMCLRVAERLVSILPVHRQRLKCSNSAKTFLNVFIVMSKRTPKDVHKQYVYHVLIKISSPWRSWQ